MRGLRHCGCAGGVPVIHNFPMSCALDAGYHRAFRDLYLANARDDRDIDRRRMYVELARNRQRIFLANLKLARKFGVA
jgi:hypothetical protein